MESVLPFKFKPAELAQRKYSGHLTLPVAHFKRFSALLADNSGEVKADARFFVGEGAQVNSTGSISATVAVTCQRCMQAMRLNINCEFSVAFISDESAEIFAEDAFDPLLLDKHQEVNAVDFLEDELILQVPLRLVHSEEQDCDKSVIEAVNTVGDNGPVKTHNPFSGLDKLLKN